MPGALPLECRIADSCETPCKPQAGKLKPGRRRPEISVAGPYVTPGSEARASPEHPLIVHELSIIFGEVIGEFHKSRIGFVMARSPFPNVAEHLRKATA